LKREEEEKSFFFLSAKTFPPKSKRKRDYFRCFVSPHKERNYT